MSYKALVIGVNEYISHFRSLETALNDIDAIYYILNHSQCHYDIKTINGKNASRANIMKELQYFFASDYNDILFLYWSGHGSENTFVTYDTDLKNINSTSIDMKELCNMIDQSTASTIVAVFDCCYSGSIARSVSNAFLNIKGDGKVIMASSDYYEESYDSLEYGHGNFTYYFIEGLRGNAASKEGNITVNGLHDYICEHIIEMKTPKKQTPVFKGTIAGTIILNKISIDKSCISDGSISIRNKLIHTDTAKSSDEDLIILGNQLIEEKIKRLSNGNIKDYDVIRAINSFENKMLDEIVNGTICEYHRRTIHITPAKGCYLIKVFLSTRIINMHKPLSLSPFIFKFISQQQVDSFKLLSLVLNGKCYDVDLINVNREPGYNTIPQPITAVPSFNRNISFSLPIEENTKIAEFELSYEYKNFCQSCFITYATEYLTKKYTEKYCIEGSLKRNYMIHGFAFPFFIKRTNYPTERINDEVLSIEFSDWLLPTTGVAVVVRKKHF